MALLKSLALVMSLGSAVIQSDQRAEIFCLDVSPYCSEEDCRIRPGYAMEFCRKTCGNCQGSLCYDSEYYPCAGMDVNGCSKYLKDYCPVLCGTCDPSENESNDDDSLSFFPSNSTFLGLFQPSHWIGQTYNPPKTAEKSSYSTTMQPTPATESGYDVLMTVDIANVAVSVASTAETVPTAPTTTASITATPSSSTSATSASNLTNLLLNSSLNPPTSTPPSTTSGSTSDMEIPLPNITAPTTTPFSTITMPTESEISTATAKATDCNTTPTTNTTTQTTQASTEATTSETIAALSSASAFLGNGHAVLTKPLALVATPPAKRKDRYHPNEWMSYIRQLSQPARSSKLSAARGSIATHTFSQPRQSFNSKTVVFQIAKQFTTNHPYGVGQVNNSGAALSLFPRRKTPTRKHLTATRDFARPQRRLLHHQQEPSPPLPPLLPPQSLSRHPASITDIVTLLGCRDHDERTCSQITEVTCHARPGYYLKLCPVKCKNCNGLLCYDSNKVDCAKVVESGGCQIPNAAEYCPQSCDECPKPAYLNDAGSRCKDEFPTCKNLAASGICHHIYNVEMLRLYCAKSCGFCKESPFYFMDARQYNPLIMQLYQMRSRS